MEIRTDSLYRIGRGHLVCQDYSLAGTRDGYSYAIVSDGCSTSKDTDIGARLLVHCALRFLSFIKLGYKAFGETVINYADMHRTNLGLDVNCLDATLLVTMIDQNSGMSYTYVYGDGYVIKTVEDAIYLVEYKFESGAPFYLRYWLDNNEVKRYEESFKDKKLITNTYRNGELTCSVDSFFNESLGDIRGIAPGSLILSSDGLDSFSGMKDTIMKAHELYQPFIAFKVTKGEYLKRRAIKECEALEKRETPIFHHDDLGMSSILILDS